MGSVGLGLAVRVPVAAPPMGLGAGRRAGGVCAPLPRDEDEGQLFSRFLWEDLALRLWGWGPKVGLLAGL